MIRWLALLILLAMTGAGCAPCFYDHDRGHENISVTRHPASRGSTTIIHAR